MTNQVIDKTNQAAEEDQYLHVIHQIGRIISDILLRQYNQYLL